MFLFSNVDEAVTEEVRASNDIEIYIKDERNTRAYLKTMNIDIENINTFENRNKVYTTQWRKIYEFIEPEFLREIVFFRWFFEKCKDNANESHFLPLEVKIT